MADVDMLVEDGEEVIVDLMTPESWYVAIGTDDSETLKNMTDLQTPSPEARTLAVASEAGPSIAQYVGTVTDTTGQTIDELGLFDAAGAGSPPAGGVLIARGNQAAGYAIMLVGDDIEITCTIEIT